MSRVRSIPQWNVLIVGREACDDWYCAYLNTPDLEPVGLRACTGEWYMLIVSRDDR